MECAQVTEEQRLWTETQLQKAKHNAWPSCLASVYLTEFTYSGTPYYLTVNATKEKNSDCFFRKFVVRTIWLGVGRERAGAGWAVVAAETRHGRQRGVATAGEHEWG